MAWAAAVVVAIEGALSFFLPDNEMIRTLELRARQAVEEEAPEIQIIGDSSVAVVFPGALVAGAGAGHSVGNYSLPGTSAVFQRALFERQAAAGRLPEILVYAGSVATLNQPLLDRFAGRFATWTEMGEVLEEGAPWGELAMGLIGRASYTVRYRDELRGVITGGRAYFWWHWGSLWKPAVGIGRGEDARRSGPDRTGGPWTVEMLPQGIKRPLRLTRVIEESLIDLGRRARARGVTPVWVSLPLYRALLDIQKGNGSAEALDRFLAKLEAEAGWVILIRQPPEWPDAVFVDPVHMNREAGEKLGRMIGDALRERGLVESRCPTPASEPADRPGEPALAAGKNANGIVVPGKGMARH